MLNIIIVYITTDRHQYQKLQSRNCADCGYDPNVLYGQDNGNDDSTSPLDEAAWVGANVCALCG